MPVGLWVCAMRATVAVTFNLNRTYARNMHMCEHVAESFDLVSLDENQLIRPCCWRRRISWSLSACESAMRSCLFS